MASGFGTFSVGGAVFPLVSPGTNTALQDADPTLYYALDFWAAMLRQHMGARLLSVVSSLGLSWTNSTGAPDIVRQQYPYDVGPHLPELQGQMPLLACWRGAATYNKHTAGYYDDDCKISVAYIFPPLHASQAEQLIPFLRAAEAIIRNRTVQAWDPSYAPPGGSIGDQFDSADFANVEEIGFLDGAHGSMPASGNLVFPMLIMHGFVIERDMAVDGQFPAFSGGDITVDLIADDLTTFPDLIEASTQQAPTITSLDVTGGPIAGGTSVTITGTLFLTGPMVLVGNTPASSIVWNSATSITFVTPAVSGPGTMGVVVINRDSQSATLPNAFTFS